MTNDPVEGRQDSATPPPPEPSHRPRRPWLGLALAMAVLAWVAVAARTAAEVTASRPGPDLAEPPSCTNGGLVLRLPPGHPPIRAWPPLPPGHPPIGLDPGAPSTLRLPAGHPPIGPGTGREPRFPAGFMFET